MAQLLSGVSSTALYWPVDEIPESDYVRCGDEVVRVLVRHPTRQRIRVERGVEGTTAASHAADAEVSAAYVVGIDGGGDQVRLVGPWHFAHDTPLLMDPVNFGADLGTIPAGSVFQGFVVITESFNQPGELTVNASVNGTDGSNVEIASYNPPDARNTSGDEIMREPFRPDGRALGWLITTIEAHVVVGFYPSGDDPTTGEGDFYALIVEPA